MKKMKKLESAYATYTKAMAKLHKDAIPNEPLPAFYRTQAYLDQWGKLTNAYMKAVEESK